MARHHVNPNTGNPGICKASKSGCPFGGESGEENHYKTAEEANQAAEKLMADQYSAVNTAYRKKDGSALAGMNREMKKRIISEAASGKVNLHPSVVAKVFSKDNDELIRKNVSENFRSQKILREMSTDESARVRLAVASSTNNPGVLKALANDPDIKVRKAAIANQKTPVKARKAALSALGIKPTASPSNKKTTDAPPRVKKGVDTPATRPKKTVETPEQRRAAAIQNIKHVATLDRYDAFQKTEMGSNFHDDSFHIDADKESFVVEVKKPFKGEWGLRYETGDLVEIKHGEMGSPMSGKKVSPELRKKFPERVSW